MSKKRKTASVTPIFFDFKMVGRTNLHLVKIVEDFTEATWTELESKTITRLLLVSTFLVAF